MKYIVQIAAILTVSIIVHTATAEDVKRTATIVDTAGVTSEVTDLSFWIDKLGEFNIGWGSHFIGLSGDGYPIDLAIPLDRIISMQAKGKGHAVTYLWRGKEITANGKLFSGKFTGKSDFGDLKLDSGHLMSIKFDRPPTVKKQEKEAKDRATITIDNGTKMSVDNLRRYDRYYSTEGYSMGGRYVNHHFTDVRFLRGETLATVEFAKMIRIDFTGDIGISVTLNNEKNASGKTSTEAKMEIEGFTGDFDKGHFYIAKEHVRTIEFKAGAK